MDSIPPKETSPKYEQKKSIKTKSQYLVFTKKIHTIKIRTTQLLLAGDKAITEVVNDAKTFILREIKFALSFNQSK